MQQLPWHTQRGTSPRASQILPTGDSDIEDDRQVESLINPYDVSEKSPYYGFFSANGTQMSQSREVTMSAPERRSVSRQTPTSPINLPTLALNNVAFPQPFTFSQPLIENSRESSPVSTVNTRGAPLQHEQTASARGSKRSSPQPSLEREIRRGNAQQGGSAPEESSSAKVRLVGIPDPQRDSLITELTTQVKFVAETLKRLEMDMQSMKKSTTVTVALLEKVDKRATDTKTALEKECTLVEQRFQTLKSGMEEQTSRQVHDAEKRLEEMLKSMKNIEQASRPRDFETDAAHDDMVVEIDQHQGSHAVDKGKQRADDSSQSGITKKLPARQIPVPPRFPEPPAANEAAEPSRLPLLNFKRPKSKGKSNAIPHLNKTFLHEGESSEDDNSTSDGDANIPRSRHKFNITDLSGEDVMKLLLTSIGVGTANFLPLKRNGRRRAHPDFKDPARKTRKARGKQTLMNWLRQHLHELLGIEKSRDILMSASEIYSENTPLQRHMAQWEKTKQGEGPKVKPMKINWNEFDGAWNTRLCELFVEYCASEGLEGGNPGDEAKDFIAGYFWDRLSRLRTIIKNNKPKKDETQEQTSTRTGEQHLQALSIARRNSRRNQKHSDRIDICLENLPENIGGVATDDQCEWKTRYDVVMALGPEGVSSDETDENDPDNYWVRTLPWRSKWATRTMIAIDEAKNTTNAYGNVRAGNRPRNRQRRKNAANSVRKVPTGKPENMYDQDWFAELGDGKKRALKVKASIECGH